MAIGAARAVFQLAPGGGDESLGNPAAGKAAEARTDPARRVLPQGANEIRLTVHRGFLGAVRRDHAAERSRREDARPQIQSVTVRFPRPYFIRSDGQVRRAVDVAVALTAPAPEVSLRVEAAGEVVEASLTQLPQFGSIEPGGRRARLARSRWT